MFKDQGSAERVIQMTAVATSFGDHVVHSDITLEVLKQEVFAVIGGSGSGKSTLLREMILLQKPTSGSIKVLDVDLAAITPLQDIHLRQRWGVMFQHGGLLGSLTVIENVGLPMREHTELKDKLIDEIAHWKLSLVGLAQDVGAKLPSALSGGMMKRASFARAMALDPELLFLDEPTAGLDPASAAGIDDLIHNLRELFGLTIVMITHDLDLLWQVSDRVAVLADGKIQAIARMDELSRLDTPSVRQFFDGPRGRAASPSGRASSKLK
jgi:phospholipid/cholesterol/gamma-HCH transport system ATP-binding protein